MSKTIGERIKEMRIKSGLTQQKLSDLTSISYTTISNYETGKKEVGLFNLSKIAKALNVSIDYLYNGAEVDMLNGIDDRGLKVATALKILVENQMIFVERNNDYGNMDKITFNYHINVTQFINKLYDIENNREVYPEPEMMKDQFVLGFANMLNGKKRR